jgi:hypothetical protein
MVDHHTKIFTFYINWEDNMRKLLQLPVTIVLVASLYLLTDAVAQDSGDRLSRLRDLIDNNELIMIWSQGENANEHYSHLRIYNLDMTQSEVNQRLVPAEIRTDSLVTGNRQMAVATGNFLGGRLKNFVAAWPGPNNTITISIPEIDSNTLSITESHRVTLPGPLAPSGSRKIQLVTGDFFGSERSDEIVLAYQGADSTVHLQLFSFDTGSLIPEPRGTINDEKIFIYDGTRHDNWDIVSGDFNGNGYHEIALLFVKPLGGFNWALTAKIYSVNQQGELIPEAFKEIFYRPYHIPTINISGTIGDFANDPSMEIAFGFTLSQQGFEDDTFVYILDVQDNLNTIATSVENRIAIDAQNESEITPINVAAGDLNGDFRDEIVIVTGGSTYIYSIHDQLIPERRLTRGAPASSGGNEDYFLVVGDMDGSGRAEIVTGTNFRELEPGGVQYFEIWVMSIDEDFTGSLIKARREFEEQVSAETGYRNFAIAMGDFTGERTWLGSPVHYRLNSILQPSVVLYAPPIHYDILNSTVYDLSDCYPNQGCGFLSSYVQTTTEAQTVSIEHHEDWGVSASLEVFIPGSRHKAEVTYGEKFSNSATQRETMSISSGRTSAGDDWIFTSTYDLDFYEYPVYDGDDPTPIGHFLVSIPRNIRPLWIEAKNDQLLGNNLHPDHEVGNILSYRPYEADAPSHMNNLIVEFQEQTIGATGNSHVSLEQSIFSENQVEESWEGGVSFESELDAVFDVYGAKAGFKLQLGGQYSRGEIVTQSVSVEESLEMRSDFGHVQSSFGTAGTYYVKPYAYWASSGALVLDYMVDIPEGNNFWRDHYNAPDLGFSLPWRYDEHKGIPFPGNDPGYIQRTRDIALSDPEPAGGDTVTIGARVRNMGLQDVSSPFSVRFYYGDPMTNGLLIAETLIDTVITSRQSRNTFVEWIIPAEFGFAELNDARIYVHIDPENQINNEIHNNNNIGWAPVISGTVTGVIERPEIPDQFVLHHSYPNPFNPAATIRYALPENTTVRLEVYNVLGQVVEVLVDEMQHAGVHEVQFNASHLASGMYIYRITAGAFVESKRMLLLK